MVKVFHLSVVDEQWNADIELGIFSSLKQAKAIARNIFPPQPEWYFKDEIATYIAEVSGNTGVPYTLSISVWEMDDESAVKEYKENWLGKGGTDD